MAGESQEQDFEDWTDQQWRDWTDQVFTGDLKINVHDCADPIDKVGG